MKLGTLAPSLFNRLSCTKELELSTSFIFKTIFYSDTRVFIATQRICSMMLNLYTGVHDHWPPARLFTSTGACLDQKGGHNLCSRTIEDSIMAVIETITFTPSFLNQRCHPHLPLFVSLNKPCTTRLTENNTITNTDSVECGFSL